ncbi:Pentatricopeptide repeat-containing protein At2g41720 [Linum perenne]
MLPVLCAGETMAFMLNHHLHFTSSFVCKMSKKYAAFEEKKIGFVDYDRGEQLISTDISGVRQDKIPRRYRLRVDRDRFQKDWSLSQVVHKVLELDPRRDDVEGVLNHWVGRFARRNFPYLIKNYRACTDIYNRMIRLLARHNRIDQARGLFFEMQKWRCKPDVETYNALINAHGRAGQWRWAMNIMEDMLREAITPSRSTYNNLINSCGSSGNWREALKICKKMTENGVGPDLVTHNIVLSAYKTGAQYSKALSYFELMKGTNIRPDTTTLNIVMYCLVKLGQYEKALDIFNSMRDKRADCFPDVVTFTTIVHLYSSIGKIENCLAVFNTMLSEGMRPNIVSYNALIGAYASRGMSDEALSVFEEIRKSGFSPDVVSYTSLLNSYGRSHQPAKAREVFEMMKKEKLKPNIVSYNALIDAYGSNGLLLEAVAILREMELAGIKPNVVSVSTLLASCTRCGRKVNIDAVLLAAEMRGIKLNTVAYNSAIGAYMNVGEYEKANALYRSMGKRKVLHDSVTYTVLISGCCKMSKYGDATEYFSKMIDSKMTLTKEGRVGEAESVFNMMKTSGCYPDVIAYTMMLHTYNSAGEFHILNWGECWEKACGLLQEMEANGVQPDTIAYSSLMRAFNKGGDPGQVLILAQQMSDKGIPFSDAIFVEMISACSMLRDWKKAVDLVRLMEPCFPVVSIGLLNQLLHLLGKSGKVDSMVKLFYKIIASGAEINLNSYSILLRNLLAVGNWRKYLEVLEWMESSRVEASFEMYEDICNFGHKHGGEYASTIKERVDSLRSQRKSLVVNDDGVSREQTAEDG